MHQTQDDKQADGKKLAINAGIARLTRFIWKHAYDTAWGVIANAAGVGDILESPQHDRLRRAQHFGDPDYPEAISRFLREVFETDEEVGLFVVQEIVEQPFLDDMPEDARDELEEIVAIFNNGELSFSAISVIGGPTRKLLNPIWLPDNFYQSLIDEINEAYAQSLPFALSVLLRKLLENLVIDILRSKYGTADLQLYYQPKRRRFHDLSILVRNLGTNKVDFHYISPSLDNSFIRDLEEFRESANAAAHSIDADLEIAYFDKDKIRYLVEFLLRLLKNLHTSHQG